jgi:hypothetical protein
MDSSQNENLHMPLMDIGNVREELAEFFFAFGLSAKLMPKALELLFSPRAPTCF